MVSVGKVSVARRLKLDSLTDPTAVRWLRLNPRAAEPQFELGVLRWRSLDANSRSEGRQILWGLAFGSNSFVLPAIATLAGSTHLSGSEMDLLWHRVEALAPTIASLRPRSVCACARASRRWWFSRWRRC